MLRACRLVLLFRKVWRGRFPGAESQREGALMCGALAARYTPTLGLKCGQKDRQ